MSIFVKQFENNIIYTVYKLGKMVLNSAKKVKVAITNGDSDAFRKLSYQWKIQLEAVRTWQDADITKARH